MKTSNPINWGEMLIPGIALAFGLAYWAQISDAPKTAIYWPIVVTLIASAFWLAIVVKFIFLQRKNIEVVPFDTDEPTVKSSKKSHSDEINLPEKNSDISINSWLPPVLILLLPIVYLLLMPYIGFAVGSFLFLLTMFKLLGGRSWKHMIGIALLITTVLYVAMVVLMQIALPRLAIGGFLL